MGYKNELKVHSLAPNVMPVTPPTYGVISRIVDGIEGAWKIEMVHERASDELSNEIACEAH